MQYLLPRLAGALLLLGGWLLFAALPTGAKVRVQEPVAILPGPFRPAPEGLFRTGQSPLLPLTPPPLFSDQITQAGLAWPSPRFVDNGDGTVSDRVSGLRWLRKANCYLGKLSWQEASDRVALLHDSGSKAREDDCGLADDSRQGDWRLPSIDELHELVAWQYAGPALSNAAGTGPCLVSDCAFEQVETGLYYWSATTLTRDTNSAWGLSLRGGGEGRTAKTVGCAVWPVRVELRPAAANDPSQVARISHLQVLDVGLETPSLLGHGDYLVKGSLNHVMLGNTRVDLKAGGKFIALEHFVNDFAIIAFVDEHGTMSKAEVIQRTRLAALIKASINQGFLLITPSKGSGGGSLITVQFGRPNGGVTHLGSFDRLDKVEVPRKAWKELRWDKAATSEHGRTPIDGLRFDLPGDGTVRDNLTGLIWLQRLDCLEKEPAWDKALTMVATRLFDSGTASPDDDCGLRDGSAPGDWRVPNAREMHSLMARHVFDPALANAAGDGHCQGSDCPFSGLSAQRFFWTSTGFTHDPAKAWAVDLGDGGLYHTSKQSGIAVWPVRNAR